jgi:hypothetical protein
VALAESFLAGNAAKGNGGERYQVMVHVDQDALAPDGTLAATLDDGTHLSAETFRRIACDCGLVAQGGNGEISFHTTIVSSPQQSVSFCRPRLWRSGHSPETGLA